MKILVIDDSREQLENARKCLTDHDVSVANGWETGKKAIEEGKWDIVLTDLSMPAEEDGQGSTGLRYVGQPTPYGFPLALLALKTGVPMVAIVSNGQGNDGNHHAHPIFWAADDLDGEIIPGKMWAFTGYQCPYMKENSELKNWARVLEVITKGEDA